MPKVIFCKGIPASNKSSYAKKLAEDPMWKRVNRDDIRAMLDNGKFSGKNEKLVTKMQHSMIIEALKNGYNIIDDNTNLNMKTIPATKKAIFDAGIENVVYEIKVFDISVEEAIKRDLKRENSVGSDVIYNFANKYIEEEVEENKYNSSLPNAYIFDIDGSLALMNGRSPFAWDKVGTDICRGDIKRLANTLSIDHEIIIMSGRDGICRKLTEEWLNDNGICYNYLLMREAGDCRKDTIIKRELFDKYVRGNFNIYGVFDDRPSVCREWKRMGLTVFNIDSRIWMSEF